MRENTELNGIERNVKEKTKRVDLLGFRNLEVRERKRDSFQRDREFTGLSVGEKKAATERGARDWE